MPRSWCPNQKCDFSSTSSKAHSIHRARHPECQAAHAMRTEEWRESLAYATAAEVELLDAMQTASSRVAYPPTNRENQVNGDLARDHSPYLIPVVPIAQIEQGAIEQSIFSCLHKLRLGIQTNTTHRICRIHSIPSGEHPAQVFHARHRANLNPNQLMTPGWSQDLSPCKSKYLSNHRQTIPAMNGMSYPMGRFTERLLVPD